MVFGAERLHRIDARDFFLGFTSHGLFTLPRIGGTTPWAYEIFVLDGVQEKAFAARVDETSLSHRIFQRILSFHVVFQTLCHNFKLGNFLLLVVKFLEHVCVGRSNFALQPQFQGFKLLVKRQTELVVMLLSLGQDLLVLFQAVLAGPKLANFIHHKPHSLLHGIHLCPKRPQLGLSIVGAKIYLFTPWPRAQSILVVVLGELLQHHRLRRRVFEAGVLMLFHAGARV